MAAKTGARGGATKPRRLRDKEQADRADEQSAAANDADQADGADPAAEDTATTDEAGPEADAPAAAEQPEVSEEEEEDGETDLEAAEIPGLDAKHLTGQLGDFLLEQVKHARHLKPWDQIDEFEQKRLIAHCYSTAKGAVIKAAVAISGKGFKSATMMLDQATLKDGVKITLSAGTMEDDAFLALKTNQGRLVQLVFADAEDFGGDMLSKPQPNQPDMLAGGEEETGDGDDDPVVTEDPAPARDEGDEADEETHDPETGEITTPPPAGDPPTQQPPAGGV